MKRFGCLILAVIVGMSCVFVHAGDSNGGALDVRSDEVLVVPGLVDGGPGAGKRVKVTAPEYVGTEVFHTLYLPEGWRKAGPKLPVIFEYTGNHAPALGSSGLVEGAGLGYGLSGGKYIWVSLPYINKDHRSNQRTWWGDAEATVEYAKRNVPRVIAEFGGDPEAVFLCGFSRGAIGVNFIGLHDEEIAGLWTAFITHDHFDGVKQWSAPWGAPLAKYRQEAAERLKRVGGRPYLVCDNAEGYGTEEFVRSVLSEDDNFTYLDVRTSEIFGEFPNEVAKHPHTDRWANLPSVYRETAWAWMNRVAGQAGAAKRPNVIIVLTDDQGFGDLSCHGNPVLKTPHLDRLHGQSVRLTDFHSAPVCTPTRGQLLTGRDAMHNGAWSWAFGHEMIHGDNRTMADIFKANGYRTGHFGKWHLGDNYPYRPGDKGFDETISHGGAATHQTPDYWQNDNFDDFYRHKDGGWRQHEGYCTDVWFDLSMDFMKRCQAEGQPFFLYLPTNAPHGPHYVAESDAAPYRPAGKVASFFGMIANIDENMGRLDRFLDESGLDENTVLVFMTDNGATSGYQVFNAGMRGRKGMYYDGGHRVPCFIRWPGGRLGAPRDVGALTQVQDVLPSLIDLCALDCDAATREKFDGTSLADLLEGSETELPDRKLVVQWSPKDYPERGRAAVLWKKWRLVHDTELYNIAEDPAQERDVAAKHPEIVHRMQVHYAQWWESVQPVVSVYSRIGIGGAENPSRLTCFEWTKKSNTKVNVTQQTTSMMRGGAVNGSWMLDVETAGRYRIALFRYPKEADTAMNASFPETRREFKTFPACRALPVAAARLTIGNTDETIPVKDGDKTAVFQVILPAKEVEMKTWLLDGNGRELCGAYYVEMALVDATK